MDKNDIYGETDNFVEKEVAYSYITLNDDMIDTLMKWNKDLNQILECSKSSNNTSRLERYDEFQIEVEDLYKKYSKHVCYQLGKRFIDMFPTKPKPAKEKHRNGK